MKLNYSELKSEIIRISEYIEDDDCFVAHGSIELGGRTAYVIANWYRADMRDLELDDLYTSDEVLREAIENEMIKNESGFYDLDVNKIIFAPLLNNN